MVQSVTDGVVLLEVAWPEPIGANAYLVDDGEVTLIDAGPPLPRRSLDGEIRAAGYALGDIDRVLLTHYDIDHVGGLARVDLCVPIYIGALDRRLVRRSWSPPWTHHKGAFHRLVRRVYSLSGADLRGVTDGDRIGGFLAFHTPGHNPGHTVYLHADSEAAMLGDLVWNTAEGFVVPPWVDSYDPGRIVDSVARIAEQRFEAACVGHGPPLAGGGREALQTLASVLAAEP
ncbi:MAG: glyoxylase-like metal-dependent hydrolase (beta-lactamase superfamily II) [Natronomonas sp.]|jgi:glyoxylase-like metal-dependent hydrolase (beta-lactamase superfamily II)|uniref:MBL fold metallo-hydrolase n=1 Tax=Natronomonas sp. TaxID=2184060 RepID=UPI0039894450